MSLLNSISGSIETAQNKILNPFTKEVPVYAGQDFPDGFMIEEILASGATGAKLSLLGSNLPKIPFTFGGSQRVKKDYYAGYSEPVVQIFGPEENTVIIKGELKDKKLPARFKGVSYEIHELIDSMRIRGNIVRIRLGEWERYALIENTKFDLETTQKIGYEISFSIIGFNAPSNARFLQRSKEKPVFINNKLISEMELWQKTKPPMSVPFSIADQLNSLISAVAGVIATVTNFVDSIVSTVNNIQKSIERAKGLIKYAQNKLREYKKIVGSFKAFDSSQALTGKYESAKFYQSMISRSSAMTSLLERLKSQISQIYVVPPLARHLVKEGDSFQKLSSKFYGNPENWKKIKEFNNLEGDELAIGSIIEIPRL